MQTQRLRLGLCHARLIVACAIALGQSACMLIRYENQRQDAEGGVVPDDDAPTGDGSVAVSLDGGGANLDAEIDARSDDDPSPTPPVVDAGELVDAGEVDAGISVEPPVAGCLGTPALGLCWHLGPPGRSCDETCDELYDGFDWRTIVLTGKPSEGGSLANCQKVLGAMGISAAPVAGYRPDGLGLGCHVFPNGATYWLDQRQGPFDSGDSLYSVRRACACMR